MENRTKKLFWDIVFISWICVLALHLMLMVYFYDDIAFIFIVAFYALDIFIRLGMAVSAIKRKRYGWMFVVIIFGTIFSVIFYLSNVRKDLKKPCKDGSKNNKK